MAAELSQLIERYQQQGLTQAAEHLRVLKTGLQANGLIPPRLDAGLESGGTGGVEDMGDQARPRSETVPTSDLLSAAAPGTSPNRRRILEMGGDTVLLCHDDFDDRHPCELDVLGLRPELRNALVRAGCGTITDIEFLIDHHALQRVHNIGPIRAEVIIKRVRRWAAQQDSIMSEGAAPHSLSGRV